MLIILKQAEYRLFNNLFKMLAQLKHRLYKILNHIQPVAQSNDDLIRNDE